MVYEGYSVWITEVSIDPERNKNITILPYEISNND